MAIYHFSAQVASRSAGRSAVAMAAYRSGERLLDERTGEAKFYRRTEPPQTVILAPQHAPDWVQDRGRLWNEVEKAERRKDAQLCREINLALPKEFPKDIQDKVLQSYCQREFVQRGMVADLAIHRNDPNNPHAHIMLTMREIGPERFGNKVRDWNNKQLLEQWRESWAQMVNRVFEQNQRPERVDHRSFERQGIEDRLPTIHEGPTVRQMEQRGKETDRGIMNRTVHAHNRMVIDLQAYAKEREKILAEMARIHATPTYMKKIDEEHNRLYLQRRDVSSEINKLQSQLGRIEKVKQLEKERDTYRAQQEELRPKTLWQRMTKTNQQQIDILERDVHRVEKLIHVEQRGTPPASEVPQIEKKLSVLQGTFKAIDRAFKAVDQERQRMQQEELKRRRERKSKLQERNRDRDYER